MGGAGALKELGYTIDKFHLNEGHAVFAFVEKARGLAKNEIQELKKHFAIPVIPRLRPAMISLTAGI